MENIPSLEELNNHYGKYSYEGEAYLSPLTIKSYHVTLDEFEKYRKTNKLLDVGCGRGWFLQEAKKRGWEVHGTEYSETGKELCESQGIKMKLGQLSADTFPMEEFDVITSFEVIEHINNPIEEISNINTFLRKGGLFYCTTPNFNSLMRLYLKESYNVITYPEHLSYYTKKTLNKLIESHGFSVFKFLSTGVSITRLRTSKPISEIVSKDPFNGVSQEKIIAKDSADEILRRKISDKKYLGYLKVLANYMLTVFGLGLTLKGYYIKK
jgi:2-polyprenyl-3-methyl-5-hydroxy-6-metoxy-1,4-benzoquinol methylase